MKIHHTSACFNWLTALTRLIPTALLILLATISEAQNIKTPEEAYALGQSSLEKREWDLCVFYFEKARELYTKERLNNYALSTYKCGYCRMMSVNMLDGIPYYQEVIDLSDQLSLKPNHFQVHHGSYLDLAYIYMIDKQYERSNEVLNDLFKVLETDSSDYTLHNYIGGLGMVIYNTFQLNDYIKAEEVIKEATTIIDTISLSDKPDAFIKNVGNIYGSIANYYGRIGGYSGFKKYIELQLDLLTTHLNKNDINLSWPLTGMGNYYYHYGYYHEALDFYARALLLMEVNNDTLSYRYGYIHDDIAEIYDHLEDFEKALDHIDKTVQIYEKQPHLILDYYKSVALKGSIHAMMGDTAQALEHVQIATQVYTTNPDRTTFIHDILLNVVNTYETLGDFEKAMGYAQYMLKLSKDIFPERSFEVAQNYHSIANLMYQSGRFDVALDYTDSARTANLTEDSEVILPIIQTSIESLEIKILNKVGDQNEEYLMAKIKRGSQYINRIKSQIENEINPTYQPVAFYDNAVDLCYSLYKSTGKDMYVKLAFDMSEKSRSFDLKNFIKKSEALDVANIDPELKNRKKEILDYVNSVKYEMSEMESAEGDPAKRLLLKNQYDSLTKKYQELIAEISTKNPAYYAYKYDTVAVDINKLERYLTESDTKLISFYISENSLYHIEVEKGKWTMIQKPWNSQLENSILDFRRSISSPEMADSFWALSAELYDYLLGNGAAERLTLIPDHVLNYIPFELLSPAKGEYLLERSLVRYEYSAETLLNKKTYSSSRKQMLAMAPEFTGGLPTADIVRSNIGPLPFATEEAKNVSEIMQGDFVLGFDATETAFRQTSNLYNTLHLSTHAIVDDANPNQSRLIFSLEGDTINDGYLHAFEIYNLSLNAQLVTLSACNTGFGKIKQGEGVMSLSRAFAYAGVPSTVVSLWPASDKSTPELMKYFYQNLKDGQPKDVALNNARKSYLATAKGKARHPFYWGGFVLIGDNSPIEDDTNLLVYLIPSALVIVMILTVYRRRKNRA